MSHSYPSDISWEQFARILPILETARRRTKPRTVDLYDVFCGVLYLLKSGCQWRMLPADFPDRCGSLQPGQRHPARTPHGMGWTSQGSCLAVHGSPGGKPKKLALSACMRKLLVILNSMLRHRSTWRDLSIPVTR